MIPTLWVAFGSALGGVARYGMGLFVARLTGDGFPWGTILINILGSFVIGFFGALTVPEGALPAGSNLRLFVMVGICGGFTTFSSFSLQTLNLARDGGMVPAAGNVVLSVVLCLAAVTAGQLSAEGLALRPEASAVSRTVLAVLDQPDTARPVLAAASLAAAWWGGATIEALHVRHDALEGFLPTEEVMSRARRDEIDGQAARRSADLHATFTAWRDGGGVGDWREVTGPITRVIPEQVAGADLIVIGHDAGLVSGETRQALDLALFIARQPTLLVPASVPPSLGRNVAVAWKPSEAARRAVEAAWPALLRAERVTILMACGDGEQPEAPAELLARLRDAGVPATLDRFERDGRPIGAALLAAAHAVASDLLVMGAYTHSRARQFILGGATREVLAAADLPVLLRH